MEPFRIGKIAYTNILPIYHYFDETNLSVEWINQVPTELNHGMAEGSIDIGPISAFAYAEHYPKYVLIPNISVSAWGAVRSIYLFSRRPLLSQLDGARIALTTSSATSTNLLKIILEEFEGIKPMYVSQEPDLDQMMEHADAALLIGDDALQAALSDHPYYQFDLGYEWYLRTKLSMTYAVWAIRREVVTERRAEMEQLLAAFFTAKQRGETDLQPIIQVAKQKLGGGTESFWKTYYEGLCYDLSEKELLGLKTFYAYAVKLGLLSHDVEVDILDVTDYKQQKV